MKLIEKLKKIKKPKTKAINRSYRSRRQFLQDAVNKEVGLVTRHARTGYGDRQKSIQGLVFNPVEEITYMSRTANNAIALDISKEYTKVNDNIVLLKVTRTIYPLRIEELDRYQHYYSEDDVLRSPLLSN